MMDDGKHHETIAIDEVEHPLGKLAQQGATGTGRSVQDHLGGGLGLDPLKRVGHGEQKPIRRTGAARRIPGQCLLWPQA